MTLDHERELKNAQYLAAFETFLVTNKRASRNTVLAYMTDLRKYQLFLKDQEISMVSATANDIRDYLYFLTKKEKLTSASRARKITALKLFYRYLEDTQKIANPTVSIIAPKREKSLPVYLTLEEIRALFDLAKQETDPKGIRNATMLQLLYASGLRVSELVEAHLSNLHFDTGFLTVSGKGSKYRDIPLPFHTMQLLAHYVEHTLPLLIPSSLLEEKKQEGVCPLFPLVRKGKVKTMTRQSFWMYIKTLLKKAGIYKPVSPHTFRHSVATHLLENGADIRSLQMILGHESINTVEVYTHTSKKRMRHVYDVKHPRAK